MRMSSTLSLFDRVDLSQKLKSFDEIEREFNKLEAWGLVTSVDLHNCNPETLRNADAIKEYVVQLCDLIKMKRFGECTVVNFGEDERVAGYSMTQLIETSLVSGHFANLTNSVYIDIFSCKLYNPYEAAEFTRKFFEAEDYSLHTTLRK
jgi:S-adenosylmethionine/arginine decarboxylase-like enzyme